MEQQLITRCLLASQLHSSEHTYYAGRGACQRSGVDPRRCQGIGQLHPDNVSKEVCHCPQGTKKSILVESTERSLCGVCFSET